MLLKVHTGVEGQRALGITRPSSSLFEVDRFSVADMSNFDKRIRISKLYFEAPPTPHDACMYAGFSVVKRNAKQSSMFLGNLVTARFRPPVTLAPLLGLSFERDLRRTR